MSKYLADITLPGSPTSALDAGTKSYIDSLVSARPWGYVAHAAMTTEAGNAGASEQDVAALTFTVTVSSARRYRLSFTGSLTATVANTHMGVKIWAGGAQVQESERVRSNSTGSYNVSCPLVLLNGSGHASVNGSTEFKVRLVRYSTGATTGTVAIGAASTYPAILMLEDVGPA